MEPMLYQTSLFITTQPESCTFVYKAKNRTPREFLKMIKVLLYNVLIVSPAGFEPALPKETDLKSVALDHSAIGVVIRIRSNIHGCCARQNKCKFLLCVFLEIRHISTPVKCFDYLLLMIICLIFIVKLKNQFFFCQV